MRTEIKSCHNEKNHCILALNSSLVKMATVGEPAFGKKISLSGKISWLFEGKLALICYLLFSTYCRFTIQGLLERNLVTDLFGFVPSPSN